MADSSESQKIVKSVVKAMVVGFQMQMKIPLDLTWSCSCDAVVKTRGVFWSYPEALGEDEF